VLKANDGKCLLNESKPVLHRNLDIFEVGSKYT